MNLEFNKLKYGFGDKIILDSISGEMKAGKMTAILGPSGAGKTSFLNVLMGKVRRTSGEISINGVPAEMHTFRKIIGYVPQDDVMMKELTVREVIHYSARMRLPRDWSNKQVDDLVDAILKVLNLEHVAHALIGDEINRGISGGQRKRVNIGMELAAAPLAICLDEPTSGLDSTAALKVAKILRSISRVGLTVVAIIHQPRIEIFNTFDNVLMIVPGGRTAYFGPVKKAQTYFENSLGFAFPKEANPADVLMDILSGRGKMKNNGPSVRIEAIVKFWETEGHRLIHASKDFCSMEEPDLDAVQTMEAIVKSRGAGFLKQVWSAHQRSLNQQARQLGALAMELFVGMFTGLIMGIAGRADEMYHGVFLGTYLQLSSNPNEWFLGLYGTLVGVAVAMAGGPAGVRLFGEEQVVFWRETASGHSTMAYYLGKNVSAIYRVALSSLHFTGIYIFFSKPTYGFEYQYALVFLNFFCIYGIAVVVSMVVRRENAALLTVVLGLFCAIFDGFAPTLRDARQAYVEFIFDLVPNRWAAEAQYGLSLQVYSHLYNLQYATDYFGYELDKTTRNMCMMVALAIGYRIIGYFLMIFLRRDKQR
ncbi:P-loop containing nucleoside triphosphate hydrolase protein [Chytriomyces sp. MP71]|nr:P-loop containing nucleoside triphosphate hydrolase protein [Chytriomyces sp. MP71]